MSFSVSRPGSPLPPQPRQPKPPLAPLGKVRTVAGPDGPVIWAALTEDGQWRFERQDDDATTWAVGHVPTRTVVETCLGSLLDCRAYVGSGEAQHDLERIQAEAAAKGKAA